MLVKSAALGRALAQSLGSHLFALMRGHGSVTVAHLPAGGRPRHRGEMNARLQTEVRIAGGDSGVNYLTPGEATGSMTINETVVDRPWISGKPARRWCWRGLRDGQRLIDRYFARRHPVARRTEAGCALLDDLCLESIACLDSCLRGNAAATVVGQKSINTPAFRGNVFHAGLRPANRLDIDFCCFLHFAPNLQCDFQRKS